MNELHPHNQPGHEATPGLIHFVEIIPRQL